MIQTLPILRRGAVYESLDTVELLHHRTQVAVANIGQANAGMIRRDAKLMAESAAKLRKFSCDDLIKRCEAAGDLFLHGSPSLYPGGPSQSPADYVTQLSATTGLPHALVKRNMLKIQHVLTNMRTILHGLTRGLDLSVIDQGMGHQGNLRVSYYSTTDALGLVLPSNSPGVNSIWLPAIALKTPVILKPGREEPWTPLRIISSMIEAGIPPEAFSFYPTSHEGAAEILSLCERGIMFGDTSTVERYAGNPKISVHGPGYSKVIIAEDQIDQWQKHLDVLVSSIADNGGRSCINASCILVPRYAAKIADALAQKLLEFKPLPADAAEARLAGFANAKFAASINAAIDDGLATPGATDVSQSLRNTPRLVELDGSTYLLPTIIHCESFDHPLANREFLFPFASVVEVPQLEMLREIGPSLVVSVITQDESFKREVLASRNIERLNLGSIPTSRVEWDQPHEGNLFEFLYRRRAIGVA